MQAEKRQISISVLSTDYCELLAGSWTNGRAASVRQQSESIEKTDMAVQAE